MHNKMILFTQNTIPRTKINKFMSTDFSDGKSDTNAIQMLKG